MKNESGYQNTQVCTIISTGTELTQGLIQDNHAVFLGQELHKWGIQVKKISLIPDEYSKIKEECIKAVADSSIVIITGGLGPTPDDLTRKVVADVAQVNLTFIESAWENIRRRSWGKEVPESNKNQAYIPEGFSIIKNPCGTACGFTGKIGAALVFALPGPPKELRYMFLSSVTPVIKHSFTVSVQEQLICSVYMVSESRLADYFLKVKVNEVSMHTRLEKDRIVLTLYGGVPKSRDQVFSRLVESIGKSKIRKGDISLAESILNRLIKKNMLLVFAESCTGGLLGAWMTDIPGSSKAFWGSFVTYSNEAKTTLLGVKPSLISEKGAVSEEVVNAMAQGALERSSGDICIAVSGIAGPSGGSDAKPVGTIWIALCIKNGIKMAKSLYFKGSRDFVRRKTAITCLFFVESALLGDNVLDIPAKW